MTSTLWGGSTSDPSCKRAQVCVHAWPGALRFGVVGHDSLSKKISDAYKIGPLVL